MATFVTGDKWPILHGTSMHVIYYIGCTRIALHYSISMCFTSMFLGHRTCLYDSTPWGTYSPAVIRVLVNYSDPQAITIQPGTHSLLCQGSAHTGEVLPKDTVPNHSSWDLSPCHDALHVYGVYDVAAAGWQNYQPSWPFNNWLHAGFVYLADVEHGSGTRM